MDDPVTLGEILDANSSKKTKASDSHQEKTHPCILEPCTLFFTRTYEEEIDEELEDLFMVLVDRDNGIAAPSFTADRRAVREAKRAEMKETLKLYFPGLTSKMDSHGFHSLVSVVKAVFLSKITLPKHYKNFTSNNTGPNNEVDDSAQPLPVRQPSSRKRDSQNEQAESEFKRRNAQGEMKWTAEGLQEFIERTLFNLESKKKSEASSQQREYVI